MATQTIEFPASTGRAAGAIVKVYPVGSDAAAATASAVVESANRKAIYQATFASLSGNYLLDAIDSNGVPMCVDALTGVTDTAATFQSNSISNNIVVSTNNDKAGYALSATGLDQISVSDPGVAANLTTFPRILVWLFRRFFKKSTLTATQLKTYADDGVTVNVTQAVSDDGTTQTENAGT